MNKLHNNAGLAHSDRTHIPVPQDIKQQCDAARKPHEHRWQTYERLLAIGLKYAHLEQDGIAS